MTKIDIDGGSPNCRNFRNQAEIIDISTGEKNGYGKFPSGEQKEKKRLSRKFKCPRCGHFPLEIYNFVDSNWNYICDVYVCDICIDTPSFFTRKECDTI